MIINQKVVDAMNAQIQSEFAASQQYIAIAIYFDEESLPDLAQFFYMQSEEEREHAMKFVHYLLETGAKPIIPSLPEMRNEFTNASDAVQFALANNPDTAITRVPTRVSAPSPASTTTPQSSCPGVKGCGGVRR